MRKSVKQQLALRVLSTAALMAMVSSIATAAFAAEYNVAKGSVEIVAKDGIQSITQRDDTGAFVKDEKGDIDHRQDDDITLTTKDETTGETKTTSNTVTIDAKDGNTANVTLQDVDIEQSGSYWDSDPAPIEIKGNGDTNLELNGNNTVLSGSKNHAGIEKADVNGTGTLTIKDDVNDNGTEKSGTEADTTGKLLAGGYHNSAAIGGGSDSYNREYSLADTSNITITGGDITAIAGSDGAAAIGGGYDGTGKNIRIAGNAHVTAVSADGAAVGGGIGSGNSVTITDDAVVDARSAFAAAIGNAGCHDDTTTTINITGGTVNAINSFGSDNPEYSSQYDGTGDTCPAIGGKINYWNGGHNTTCNVNINSSTGDTVVNAYIYGKGSGPAVGSTISSYNNITHKYEDQYVPADSASYKADGSSHFGEINSAIVNCYNNGTVAKEKLVLPHTKDPYALNNVSTYRHTITDGTLTKVVHNRKYMEENPNIDTSKLKDEDLHDWQLVGKVVEPTTEKDGYADYICSIDKCGQTKHVVLPKLTPEPSEPDTPSTPETPDTPDTPNKPDTPKQPDGTTPAPVTPDAPAQDGTAPVDTPAADTTATAQNVVQDAKPEAAATAAVSAAALPQTGANWLAVVGSALSGMFLLAAGFVLDRKNRRMN